MAQTYRYIFLFPSSPVTDVPVPDVPMPDVPIPDVPVPDVPVNVGKNLH